MANFDRQQAAIKEFQTCPNCGSRAVRTVSEKNFVPTGALSRPAEVSPERLANPAQPKPAQSSSASVEQRRRDDETAERIIAWFGTHWRSVAAVIFALVPLSSLGTIGEPDSPYSYGVAVNVLLGVLLFGLCWGISALAFRAEVRRRRRIAKDGSARQGLR